MSFTVFLGNLPVWVTADDIKSWLSAENLVADSIKVIRNPETQESKGFAFIDAPNSEEMNSIIRRFDRAPTKTAFFARIPRSPRSPKLALAPSVRDPRVLQVPLRPWARSAANGAAASTSVPEAPTRARRAPSPKNSPKPSDSHGAGLFPAPWLPSHLLNLLKIKVVYTLRCFPPSPVLTAPDS